MNGYIRNWINCDQTLDIIKVLGNILIFTGALLVTASPTISLTIYPFVLDVLGAIMWCLAGKIMNDNRIIQLNVFFLIINIYAIIIRI